MRTSLIAASIVLAASLSLGCMGQKKTVRRVDESVLPAEAKALLAQDAQLTSVDEVTYTKGTKIYRMNFTTADGERSSIDYNAATVTRPSGVFENSMK